MVTGFGIGLYQNPLNVAEVVVRNVQDMIDFLFKNWCELKTEQH